MACPAYSTLGYLNWLGGDPLLSTFTSWQEGDFAGLLFHELAHQLLYVKNDTAFNESFATTVERMATPLWLHSHASAATQQRWQQSLQRRELWQQLTRETRQRLQQIYEQKNTEAFDAKALEAIKSKVFDEFRATYAQLRTQWIAIDEPLLTSLALREQYYRRLTQTDEWVAQANNASFGALAAYDDWVPAMTRWWLQLRGEPGHSRPGAASMRRCATWQPCLLKNANCGYAPNGEKRQKQRLSANKYFKLT
jgi:predicted aminopeptidase